MQYHKSRVHFGSEARGDIDLKPKKGASCSTVQKVELGKLDELRMTDQLVRFGIVFIPATIRIWVQASTDRPEILKLRTRRPPCILLNHVCREQKRANGHFIAFNLPAPAQAATSWFTSASLPVA